MRLTFVTDTGQSYAIEIDPQMELENIMALLEAESGIPVAEQSISFNGKDLSDPKSTIADAGVGEDAMLLLRKKVVVAGRTVEQDAEMMRLQILGDPELMRQLRETQPDLAAAVQSNPQRFAELLRQQQARHQETELARQREIEALNANPFDVEAQRKIEEAIRQQAVMENMEHAMEYSPESFGRVTMLYVPMEINGHPVKAFVDSGAQQTIITTEYAEKCGLMRLLDTRFAGIAMGVGTAKILGRVHAAQIKLADLFLTGSFTIMEGRDVDILLGLDMLKAHQMCIDLEKNVLRIQGREVKFLAEHELPEKARAGYSVDEHGNPSRGLLPGSSTAGGAGGSTSASQSNPSPQFPGAGHTIGAPPATSTSPPPRGGASSGRGGGAGPAAHAQSRYPETSIATLMSLGASREDAIRLLDSTGGNVELAASAMF